MRASLITLLLGGALVGLQIGAESRAVATVATYGCQEAHCSGTIQTQGLWSIDHYPS